MKTNPLPLRDSITGDPLLPPLLTVHPLLRDLIPESLHLPQIMETILLLLLHQLLTVHLLLRDLIPEVHPLLMDKVAGLYSLLKVSELYLLIHKIP